MWHIIPSWQGATGFVGLQGFYEGRPCAYPGHRRVMQDIRGFSRETFFCLQDTCSLIQKKKVLLGTLAVFIWDTGLH
jgi:hypothetical protein